MTMAIRLAMLLFIVVFVASTNSYSQEPRKIRISNATLSYSALPLIAAREWKFFQEQGLDVDIILMRSSWTSVLWLKWPRAG